MEVDIGLCFADDPKEHLEMLYALLVFHSKTDGTAGHFKAKMIIEDDSLVIDISKGFHCIHIPFDNILQLFRENEILKKKPVSETDN